MLDDSPKSQEEKNEQDRLKAIESITESFRVKYNAEDCTDIDKMEALSGTLALCEAGNYPLPEWALDILHTAFIKYRDYEVSSLDEAFGLKRRTDTRTRQTKTRVENYRPIYAAVFKAKREGIPVDIALFEKIGEELGISGDQAKKIYYNGPEREENTLAKR